MPGKEIPLDLRSTVIERHIARLKTWEFWRNHALYFCVYSVVCHWLEIPYSLFMEENFGIVGEFSVIWEYPFYPYLAYGFAVLIVGVFLIPLRDWIWAQSVSRGHAAATFYVLALIACIVMEAGCGMIINAPDANGVYPLWDNSDLPLNILGQAWLPNDILFALLASVYVWVLYPASEQSLARMPRRAADILTVVVVIAFVALCIWQFSTVPM